MKLWAFILTVLSAIAGIFAYKAKAAEAELANDRDKYAQANATTLGKVNSNRQQVQHNNKQESDRVKQQIKQHPKRRNHLDNNGDG